MKQFEKIPQICEVQPLFSVRTAPEIFRISHQENAYSAHYEAHSRDNEAEPIVALLLLIERFLFIGEVFVWVQNLLGLCKRLMLANV